MQKVDSEGFDFFRHRDEMKAKRDRAASTRRLLKRMSGLLVFCASVVLAMHALGGVGHLSHWMRIWRHLSAISAGTPTLYSQEPLTALTAAIPNKRGNHSALAGVYCVDALHKLNTGRSREARPTLGILKNQFSSEPLFADHWRRENLVKACPTCEKNAQPRTCTECNGSGEVRSTGTGLRGSRRHKTRTMGTRDCFACKGQGTITADPDAECPQCRGPGTILSRTAVQEHLDKALTKARVAVSLKCIQCALSFRSPADIPSPTESHPESTSGIPEARQRALVDELDAVVAQRRKDHAALVAKYKAAVHDIADASGRSAHIASASEKLDEDTAVPPNALLMEPRLKDINTVFMKELETLQMESRSAEKALYDAYLTDIRRSESDGRLTPESATSEVDRLTSDSRYREVEFENALYRSSSSGSPELARLVEIWNREKLSLDVAAVRCEKTVHAKYTSALEAQLKSAQESGDLAAWEIVNKAHQSAQATNRLPSDQPSTPAMAELYDKAHIYLIEQRKQIEARQLHLRRLYLQHLDRLCRRLVMEGKIERARAVRAEIDLTEREQVASNANEEN